jgi:hypothetical protein
MYDPVLGRFPSIDPIAEQFEWVSSYNYAENEPIACVDWHGLQKVSVIADALDLNDDKGLIKSAPGWARDEQPNLAGLKDASYIVLNYLTPLNAIDNAIAGFFDPNTSTSEAVTNAPRWRGLAVRAFSNETQKQMDTKKTDQAWFFFIMQPHSSERTP